MRIRGVVAALVLMGVSLFANSGRSQTAFTGSYTFTGTTGTNNPFAYNGISIPNLTVSTLDRVNLPVSSSSGNFRSTGFALDPVVGSMTGAIDLTKYFQFSLTAASGYTLDLSSFNFGIGRSATGPRSWEWRSSFDGYSNALSNYTTLASGVTNTTGVLSTGDVSVSTQTNNVLSLSSLTGLSSVTFRLYGYNSEGAAGTGGLQGPLTFAGILNTLAGIAYSWTGTGSLGTWENGGTGSFGTAYVNATNSTVTFAGTGGSVTVSGAVQAGTLIFGTGGYSLNSGSLSLGQGSVVTSNGVTTINSSLTGSSGLIKSGNGSLALGGANTFTGNVTVTGGTLEIGSDSALGDAANDLVNSGTVKTTANLALGAGRDVSGSGTFDIANATTLTVNGAFSNSATTLANSGTLSLQGATRNVGNLTLNAAATINAAGAINASGLTASGLTSGTATVNPDIIFTSGDKTVNVAGGTLDLNGALSNGGGTGRLAKTGAGTLILSGSNTMGGLRIGASAASPTDGGTVILETSAVGTQAQAIQHNFGTLQAASALVITSGLSIGGRTGAAATLAGSDMEFQGQSAFFRGTGTTGEMALNVNNKTTLSGGLAVSSGSGTATGVTVGGTGTLIISGTSSGFVDRITTANSVKLVINSSDFGADVSVSANTVLGGAGTLKAVTLNGGTIAPGNSPGVLSMASLAGTNGTFLFEIGAPTTRGNTYDGIDVTGALTLGSGSLFDFTKLDSYAFKSGDSYDLFNWGSLVTGSADAAILQNLQTALNADLALTGDLSWDVNSFLTTGAISVIPEPSSQLLMMLGMAGLVGIRAIRRKQS